MKPSDMNQEPVPLVRSRLKMLSMTLAGAPAPAPVAQVDHLADCLRAVLFLIRRDAPSLSGKALGLADAALQAYDTATAPVAQPVSQCSLKCTTECLARVHGCASECPALPWQPAAPAPVAPESFDAWWDDPTPDGPRPDGPVSRATAQWIWNAAICAAPAPVAQDQPTERDEQMAELLRSACAIADRQGEGTHWRRFGDSIRALGLNGITARTYRVLPSDHEGLPAAPAPVAPMKKTCSTCLHVAKADDCNPCRACVRSNSFSKWEPSAPAPVAQPLTPMQAVLLWGHRSDGPSTAEIVSFASAVERTCAAAWGVKLAQEGGAA